METKVNGVHAHGPPRALVPDTNGGIHPDEPLIHGLEDGPSQEELESELPVVYDGQVPLAEVLSRLVQTIYAELIELAETLPNERNSDAARKRMIADWVVKTKKQVVKLYAVTRWARDAGDVQKAMNITSFLLEQNRQFEEAIQALITAKEGLAPARARNHDLLTSLDILTTGTYQRLPTQIKKFFIKPEKLTSDEVKKTLQDMEHRICYRLRTSEVVPVEMSQYQIYDGRAFFTVPNLFETSISLRGARKDDGWFFVHVEFLHTVGGDLVDVQEFPQKPTDMLKLHITEEADRQLALYVPLPTDPNVPPELQPPPRPQLSPDIVDTPLVRLFNFLQIMSFSYQLEILFFQAQRLRSLGWKDYLTLEKRKDNKGFIASYWICPAATGQTRPTARKTTIPPLGGTVTISLVQKHSPAKAGGGPLRSPVNRLLAKIQQESRLGNSRPSDEAETFQFEVRWEPTNNALGANIPPELAKFEPGELVIDPQNLDFESILRKAIMKHVFAILAVYQHSLQHGLYRAMFSFPGEVELSSEGGFTSLRVHLCAEEYLTVSIDPRTGRVMLRDTGGLSASIRAARYAMISDRINEDPFLVYEILVGARFTAIIELAEQKAQYMGLQTFRNRNLSRDEIAKFGPDIRAYLFIQLASFQQHYLVLLVTELEFRFALVSLQVVGGSPTREMVMHDIAWLDVQRIHSGDVIVGEQLGPNGQPKAGSLGGFGPFNLDLGTDRFKLESEVLRELYAYCCARVAYIKVELQLKLRSIPYSYISATPGAASDLSHLQSSLARSVPALCVQSSDILAGVPAAEAAMPNIRVIPLNWWFNKKLQVVTCVKLKYVQQPIGKRAGTSTVIRPSKRIIYDAREAIVSFLSENVDTCVDEFLEEWAKVSKMVVIAREVAQMAKQKPWDGVRLLSFDLQTVEFAYAKDYTVSITCTDQLMLSSNTSYELSFSRIRKLGQRLNTFDANGDEDELFNPHEDAEPFLRHILRHGPRLSSSLRQLVRLLRDSLPMFCIVDALRRDLETVKEGRERQLESLVDVDIFPKAAGWYRILYGNFRHALDLRLMRGRRVALLDAASFFATAHGKAMTKSEEDKDKAASAQNEHGVLLPISNFPTIAQEAIRDAMGKQLQQASSLLPPLATEGSAALGQQKMHVIVPLETGIICDADAVGLLAPALHSRIVKSLSSGQTDL